jgi:hypothetical protein
MNDVNRNNGLDINYIILMFSFMSIVFMLANLNVLFFWLLGMCDINIMNCVIFIVSIVAFIPAHKIMKRLDSDRHE